MLYLRQYYLGCLSHASYLVGDTVTGRAAVIDPQRDIQQYLDDAAANGLHVEYVIESHFHADFLSGHLELAAATGATIVFGRAAEGRTEFPILAAHHGDVLELGDRQTGVVLEVLETPGHTPESISVVVREAGVADEPVAVFTGDTLFIGDVGRPDLLSAVGHDATDLGRQLYRSLHQYLLALPDHTRVLPAHGAGSACGKHLSNETESTIGDQRRTNYALQPMSEDAFVEAVTQGQAAAPMYFLFAATKNRQAHHAHDETADIRELTLDELLAAREAGTAVVDTRDEQDFAAAHFRGSINVGLGGRFAEYTGEVVAPGTPIAIVADRGHEREAVVRLARIGFDEVLGVYVDPARAFLDRPDLAHRSSRLTVDEFDAVLADTPDVQVLDVRGPGETELGTVHGATVIQLPQLIHRIDDLDPQRPTVVYCAGGYRSSIAASLLRARGFADVSDLLGGYTSWAARHHPLTSSI
jgi:glyoxylase-like metal-dependent hydrolase (beta-lactamase superfamily II)/rhodanese-related sulfurtransferase